MKKTAQANIRITEEMKAQIKQTGYSISQFCNIAIQKQLTETPADLQIKEAFYKHDIEALNKQIAKEEKQASNEIKTIEKQIKLLEKQIKERRKRLEKEKQKYNEEIKNKQRGLEQTQQQIKNYNKISKETMMNSEALEHELNEITETVATMVAVHEEKQKYNDYKQTFILPNETLNLFSRRTGLLKHDIIKELRERGLEFEISYAEC